MATGVVKWFNGQKGFGFIQPDNGGRTYLFILAQSSVRAFMDWPKGRSYPSRPRLIRGAERRALKI
jgi:'Cold-shock' DNA-binding domain